MSVWNRSFIPFFLCLMVYFDNSADGIFQSGKDVLSLTSRNAFSVVVNDRDLSDATRAKKQSAVPVVIQGRFDTPINDYVSKTTSRTYYFPYEFSPDQCWAIEICVKSISATADAPLLVVGRQSVSSTSMNVPLTFRETKVQYNEVCRTICPLAHFYPDVSAGHEEFDVEITTKSPNQVQFDLLVSNITNFVIRTGQSVSINITASTPSVFEYHLPDYVHSVLVHVSSNSDQCMVVAVQDIKCPFYDTERTAEYEGFYQTMTYQGGIVVTRNAFKSGKVYIVMILKPTDADCSGSAYGDVKDSTAKEITLTVVLPTTDEEFYLAVFLVLGILLLIYLVAIITCVCITHRRKKEYTQDQEALRHFPETEGSPSNGPDPNSRDANTSRASPGTEQENEDQVDVSHFDMLADAAYDKEVIRTKEVLFVSDLYKKKEKRLKKHASIYFWNLCAIALFYGLPVIQLVFINQKIVNITGNQDLCYYNFLCSYRLGIFSDFNHVYSNIGYLMFGLLFMVVVWWREFLDRRYPTSPRPNSTAENQPTGVAHHSGIFYAMGWALIMEAVLSGSYHVCPNMTNFQFDTAFMYVIGAVCILQMYHSRHPDITAKSHSSWMLMALIVLIGVIGVLQSSIAFWIVFILCHIFVTFLVSTSVYYMWTFKLHLSRVKRAFLNLRYDMNEGCCKPDHPERFIAGIIAVLVNLGLDIMGVIVFYENFPFFLLLVFIVNLFLYLIFYIIMKVRYKERVRWIPAAYLLLSLIAWGVALLYFYDRNSEWKLTPAGSREINKMCYILNFYDTHDIWHFTSSLALFLSFMGLLTLDDDQKNTPRDQIHVF